MNIENWIQILMLFVTTIAVIIALFQDKINNYLNRPKAVIENHNIAGELTTYHKTIDPFEHIRSKLQHRRGILSMDYDAYYYRLKVVNKRRVGIVKNCFVNLVGITRINESGSEYRREIVPCSYVWAPAELDKSFEDISTYKIFGFIKIIDYKSKIEEPNEVEPTIRGIPHNFKGMLSEPGKIIYHLKIEAEGLKDETIYKYQVDWDGQFSDKKEEMENHLKVNFVGKYTMKNS